LLPLPVWWTTEHLSVLNFLEKIWCSLRIHVRICKVWQAACAQIKVFFIVIIIIIIVLVQRHPPLLVAQRRGLNEGMAPPARIKGAPLFLLVASKMELRKRLLGGMQVEALVRRGGAAYRPAAARPADSL
jgi:hypothetical protein